MKAIQKFIAYMVIATMSLGVVGCSSGNNEKVISSEQGQVIATVNGENIYQSNYDELYSEYYNYFGANETAVEYLNEQSGLLVDELVNTMVLMQKADQLGIKCSEEDLQKTYSEIKEEYGEETFNQMLETSGISEQSYLEELKKQIILLKLQEVMLEGTSQVTDQEVKTYYEEHQEEFTTGAGADMSHILVRISDETDEAEMKKVDAAVKKIEDELASGKSFEALEKEYSADDVDKSLYVVEDLGFIEYESPYLDKAFLEAARELSDGEVSGPVRSSFGYHFIKVDHISKETVAPLEDVKDEIKTMIQDEKNYAQYQEVLEEWVSEAKVEIFEDRIQEPAFVAEIKAQQEATKQDKEATAEQTTEQATQTAK